GTGAAPLIFTDSVSLPFQLGVARGYSMFARKGPQGSGGVIGAGRLGRPAEADLHALGVPALPARVPPRVLDVRAEGPPGLGGVHRRREARPARQRDRGVRPRVRT